jgi:hypothetical protein
MGDCLLWAFFLFAEVEHILSHFFLRLTSCNKYNKNVLDDILGDIWATFKATFLGDIMGDILGDTLGDILGDFLHKLIWSPCLLLTSSSLPMVTQYYWNRVRMWAKTSCGKQTDLRGRKLRRLYFFLKYYFWRLQHLFLIFIQK